MRDGGSAEGQETAPRRAMGRNDNGGAHATDADERYANRDRRGGEANPQVAKGRRGQISQ